MRIAVLGARGQLGAAIVHEFARQYEVVPLDRSLLDVTDSRAVQAAIDRSRPQIIINCVAFNAVDAAEDQPIHAFKVNAVAVRTLARAARACNATLIHYSSDFVFDGEHSVPYTEDDQPNPRSVYAASKLMGEWFASDVPVSYVLRVESLFGRAPEGPPAKGSAAMIIDALRRGAVPKVFHDRTVSPTYVIDAARATRKLIENSAPAGIYHCVNSGSCTWIDFARQAAALLNLEPRFEPCSLDDLRLPAARPRYCALSTRKLQGVGIEMPTWRDALARHAQSLLLEHVSR